MEVANDGVLITWTNDSSGLIVQEREFEENVMQMYPGFVQVETFHNLRRLFRDYSFKFRILQRKRSSHGLSIEFRHPSFSRNSYDQLPQVKKRQRVRKSKYVSRYQRQLRPMGTYIAKGYKRKILFQNQSSILRTLKHEMSPDHSIRDNPNSREDNSLPLNLSNQVRDLSPTAEDQYGSFHSGTTSRIFELFSGAEVCSPVKPERKLGPSFGARHTTTGKKFLDDQRDACARDENCLSALLQVYAKNELSEGQFWEFISRSCCIPCSDMSWEMIKECIDRLVYQELSPLHFKGFYYELALSEL